MTERMTELELKALIDGELSQALGTDSSTLSEQRRKAIAYYYAEPKGDLSPPEIEGRSSVVSPDVRNTVESMLPQLVAKFVSGDKVVQFEPTKKGDDEKADSATTYLNHIFFKKNNGHSLTVTWAKDGLLQKRGFLKAWWDTRTEEKREEYKGLTQVELAQIMDDPEVEPIEQTNYPDEQDAEQRAKALEGMTQQLQQAMQAAQQPGPQQQQAAQAAQQMQAQLEQLSAEPPAMLYDVSFKRSKTGGKLTIEPIPPECFILSKGATSIKEARLCGHKFKRTMSDLKSMGYTGLDQLSPDGEDGDENSERIERNAFDNEEERQSSNLSQDKSQTELWVKELYLRVDYDGDGISELRKIVYIAGKIVDNEVCDEAPFVSWCPVPMPHKFYGLSAADLAMEGQKTKTSIRRGQLDNMYLQVNGRYFAVEDQVDLDSLLDSRPGGVVRIKQQGAVGRLDQGMGDLGSAANMMEQEEAALENSTGWTRYSQGNDGKGLNQTLGGVQIITNKADMRVDLMARNLAEGFVDLFRLMLKLVCQNQTKAEDVRIAGEWVAMDPREWINQFDTEINVGLGVGNKDQQVQHLMALRQLQLEGLQMGVSTPEKVYELSTEIAKVMGFKSGDRFFNDPKKNPPPQQPDPMQAQMQVEQMKAKANMEVEQARLQAQGQIKQMELQQQAQLEQMRMEMQTRVDVNRQQAEAEQQHLKAQGQAALDELRLRLDGEQQGRQLEYDRWKAELDASVKVEVANIGAKVKVDNAATTTATNEIAAEVTQ